MLSMNFFDHYLDGSNTKPATTTPTVVTFVAILILLGGGSLALTDRVTLLKECPGTLTDLARDLSPSKDWDRPP